MKKMMFFMVFLMRLLLALNVHAQIERTTDIIVTTRWTDWDGVVGVDGITVGVTFLDRSRAMLSFEKVPVFLDVWLYSVQDTPHYRKGRVLYHGVATRSCSDDFGLFGGTVRIPTEHLVMGPQVQGYGILEVTAYIPDVGRFSTEDWRVHLRPDDRRTNRRAPKARYKAYRTKMRSTPLLSTSAASRARLHRPVTQGLTEVVWQKVEEDRLRYTVGKMRDEIVGELMWGHRTTSPIERLLRSRDMFVDEDASLRRIRWHDAHRWRP